MADPPASPPAPPASLPAAPPDPLFAAIDRVRETAKWIIAGFAAVGVALAGQSVLSDVGAADGWGLVIAMAAAAVGLGSVALAMSKTADVLLPARFSLAQLDTDAGLQEAKTLIDANPVLFRGLARDLHGFVELYEQRSSTLTDAAEDARQHPDDAGKQQALRNAKAAVRELTPVIDRLTHEGLYERVKTSFAAARRWIFVAAVTAGLALVVFAAAANPPPDKAEAATGAGTSAPVPVTVELTHAGASLLAPSLGCAARRLPAIAVAGDSDKLDVVTINTAGCRTIRFTLTPTLGTAVPSQPLNPSPSPR